jgi:hypothetical protein
VIVEFALNYSDVEIQMEYDDSKVLNETSLQVYACHNWNFGARACVGEWEEVDAEFDTVRNIAKFKLQELSAFVIGEREKLSIEASLDKLEYSLGEEIKITGVVRTERGFKVSNAEISYEIPGTDISGKEKTNENGAFIITLNAPNKEGSFKLLVSASKSSFKTSTVELEFSTYKKKELTLVTPDSVTIWSNNNNTIEISLINTGQETMNDVEISVSGVPSNWLDFQPKKIHEIKPSEEKIIKISIFPKDPTMDSYLITVKAASGEISTTSEFTIVPKEREEVEAQQKEETKPLTGLIYLPNVDLKSLNVKKVIYIVIPIIILIFVVFYYKKKWSTIGTSKVEMKKDVMPKGELEEIRKKLTS